MRPVFILLCLFLATRCHGRGGADTTYRFEAYLGTGYKASLGYISIKVGYSPPFARHVVQFTTGIGATVFQPKISAGINIMPTYKSNKRIIPHFGADYALAIGGNVILDSGGKMFLLLHQYCAPYAGLKFRSRAQPDLYVNVQVGYNFLLTPYPNLRVEGTSHLTQSTQDYINGYMQRKIGGGFMVMLSLSADFCRRPRSSVAVR